MPDFALFDRPLGLGVTECERKKHPTVLDEQTSCSEILEVWNSQILWAFLQIFCTCTC